MEPVIVTRGLTREYEGGVRALRGVDVDVADGEFVAVTGPSGCGKSTLLNLLGGLDRPTRGRDRARRPPRGRASEARWAHVRRDEIGFVFQFFNLIGEPLGGRQRRAAGAARRPLAARGAASAAASCSTCSASPSTPTRPRALSGGQQQRVAIARALVNRPRVLLADEPTGQPRLRERPRGDGAAARDARRGGQTIVLVTHDARVAARADRVLAMRDGASPARRGSSRATRSAVVAPDAAGGVSDARRRPRASLRADLRSRRPAQTALTAVAIFAAATALVVTLALRAGLDDPFADAMTRDARRARRASTASQRRGRRRARRPARRDRLRRARRARTRARRSAGAWPRSGWKRCRRRTRRSIDRT